MPNQGSLFKKVLFCTDFSENADLAFNYAKEIAESAPENELTILHVIPEPEAQFWQSYLYESDNVDDEHARQAVKKAIDEHYLSKLSENQRVTVQILLGRDYEKILTYAKEQNMDLIVIGRQGKSEIGTILFGNVTEKITRHADCNVLVVPRSYMDSTC